MALGEEAWRTHAELIGQVTLSWNRNVHQVLRIFCHLSGLDSPLAEAIFFSHQSDRSQRMLIRRVAEAVGLAETDRRALEKLMKRLDEVAVGRNLATHTIFGVSLFDPITGAWGAKVVPALQPAQDKRLEADPAAQFGQVNRDLDLIYRALEDWLVHTPFPPRAWGMPTFSGLIPGQPQPPFSEPSTLDLESPWSDDG